MSIACERCGSLRMDKLVSRCMYVMSEETRMERMLDPSKLGDLNEDDPRSVARWAKRFGSELGEDMGEDFDSMMEELESGKMPSEEKDEPERDSLGGDGLD